MSFEWLAAKVVDTRIETPRVRSLLFEPPDWGGQRAGQHVDIRLTAEDGYQAQRSYSIGSAPLDDHLVLTVERIEEGEVSPYLVDLAESGDELELRGPIGGYFVWEPSRGGPLQLAAGGSGIVPLMAMLRHRAAQKSSVPTRLLYSSRTFEEIIYRQELAQLAADPTLMVAHTLTRRQPPDWIGYRRRIDRAMLAEVTWPPSEQPQAFVCGPTALVESVATVLVELGHDPSRIKTERFGPSGGTV